MHTTGSQSVVPGRGLPAHPVPASPPENLLDLQKSSGCRVGPAICILTGPPGAPRLTQQEGRVSWAILQGALPTPQAHSPVLGMQEGSRAHGRGEGEPEMMVTEVRDGGWGPLYVRGVGSKEPEVLQCPALLKEPPPETGTQEKGWALSQAPFPWPCPSPLPFLLLMYPVHPHGFTFL